MGGTRIRLREADALSRATEDHLQEHRKSTGLLEDSLEMEKGRDTIVMRRLVTVNYLSSFVCLSALLLRTEGSLDGPTRPIILCLTCIKQ